MSREIVSGWLAEIFNRYLLLDPEAPGKVAVFDGKTIAIKLVGLNRTFHLTVQGSQVCITEHFDGHVDATISGTPAALFKMGVAGNVAPLMLKGEVEITGDMRLGRAFKKQLAEIEIDWEEYLSKVMGDITAHRVMSIASAFAKWGKQSGKSLLEDVSEYLQEESRDVISATELEMFYEDVDSLRNNVDRLQARLNQLREQA